jgi:hypothetical protein
MADIERRCVEEGLCTCGYIHEHKGRSLQVTHDARMNRDTNRDEEVIEFEQVEEA